MNIKKEIKKFIPEFLISFYHFLLALTGAFLYGYARSGIKIIGVTGTKGKSTVVDLTTRILEEGGYKTASISSIRFKIKDKVWQNKLKMAMPGRFKIQRFLKQAVKSGCQYAVLEVSSEGIKQHRHRFINFNTAVFTNLAPEHIESHGGFENYRNAKLKLFKNTKNIHIVNIDDENAEYFLEMPAEKKYSYTMSNEQRIQPEAGFVVHCSLFSVEEKGISFQARDVQFNLNLLGKFNIPNSLAAICVGMSQGISLEVCKRALEKVKVIPGRMEVVIERPFKVIVDYAHTPQSLESVYKALKKKKLICVLGACGGGRDKWKRPELGKIASQYCDKIIITNEDPYDEEPMEIINQVAEKAGEIVEKIIDRREAIKSALKSAQPGDTVIITGKGSEFWMCIKGGKKIAWDDRKVAKEEFSRLNN